ncbi:hypothetical protein BN14_11821 [Rhizoctonia solani AG-1 IB]|uniref:DUF6589 domain-containing protein n=1 Tax=Thanatephorus cucumeris (strain AG1-IB / isolate 7/3/14) TaxID=1108050 RepID=M5CCL1_THACB|nr:hypothetical protein BN14_11821 [Rhizoctonia solani AG-1 IB]
MARKRKSSELEHSHIQDWNPRIASVQPLPAAPSSSQDRVIIPYSPEPERPCSSNIVDEQNTPDNAHGKRAWSRKIDKTKAVLNVIAGQGADYKLGDFLQHLLDPETFDKLESDQSNRLRRWLRGETRKGTRPAEIVDSIYRHPAGLIRDQSQRLAHPSFADLTPPPYTPSYANSQPKTASMLPPLEDVPSSRVNSRQGLEEWMVRGTLVQVEREAEALANSDGGLARGAGVTWDILDDASTLDQRPTIQTTAPVIWSIMSTIALLHRSVRGTPAQSSSIPVPVGSSSISESGKTAAGRDPTLGIMFAISILISFRNPLVNFVQSVVAIFLFACTAHKTIYRAFNRIGLSTAHSTLHGHLKDLGRSSREALKMLGQRAYESSRQLSCGPQQYFMLIFDNVNKYRSAARRQTVAMKNEMKNGTAATAVVLEDVPPDAFDPKPYFDNIKQNARVGLTVKALFDDIDHLHLSQVGTGMVMRIILAYTPVLSANLRSQVEARFQSTSHYAKHLLRLRKSVALSFGTSSIEENTPRGASNVMHDLVGTQMEMKPEWLDNLLVIAGGDQLSIKQLETAKKCKSAEKTTYESRKWVLPVIQLWHMKLAYLRSIFRVHWFENVRSNLLGLHHGVDALGRHINPAVNDFYACHNAVKTIFETMVLTATFVIIHEETGKPLPTDDVHHLTNELSSLFGQGGPFNNCTLERLEALASTLQQDANQTHSDPRAIPSKISTFSLHSNTDQMLGNIVLFMRDAFIYLEFASAIPQGDIGRVMEVIKFMRFAFYGSHAQNYGKELLEMACRFMFEYPAKLQTAILNNWLINPSGVQGHWQENDFFQEHSNKVVKSVFNTKNSDWDSSFLRDTVSVNIRGLSQLKDNLLHFLGLEKAGSGASSPDYSADINVLAAHYLSLNAFKMHPGRRQDELATDMFSNGYERLSSSVLSNFLNQSISQATTVEQDQMDQAPEEEELEDPGAEAPLAPLIIQDGILTVNNVNIGEEL